MSKGICINTKPDKDLEGYFQNLAMDFDGVNELLKKDDCDLSYFMFSAENFEDDMAAKQESGSTEEQMQEFADNYDKSKWEDITAALPKLRKALELVRGYDESCFDYGKEGFSADLEELIEELSPYESKKMRVQLLSA
jgi:hypothetical protein